VRGWQAVALGVAALLHTTSSFAFHTPDQFSQSNVFSSAGNPASAGINVGSMTIWARNDGFFDKVVDGLWNNTYPKGTAGVLQTEGILWGGFVRDGASPELRVGGTTYQTGLRPGGIISGAGGGVVGAEDPNSSTVRAYRVRPDYRTVNLREDALFTYRVRPETQRMVTDLRAQYDADWNDWPAARGAPFQDRNGNGVYDPAVDVPGVPGADQTIWFVANDLDPNRSNLFGSRPLGLEVQWTFWSYSQPEALRNIVFKRVRVIYRGTSSTPSSARIDSMYLAQWVDPAIGDFFDDFVGCDTLRNMGYAYNGLYLDRRYNEWNMGPPILGYQLIYGPMVPATAGETAVMNFAFRPGYRNLPMTSFTYFAVGVPAGTDSLPRVMRAEPPFQTYDATLQWYNMMRGSEPVPAYPAFTPRRNHLGQPTMFELSGDAQNGTGDRDGRVVNAGDRRMFLASGPFTLARGDSQEILLAVVGGSDVNTYNSFTQLRANADVARAFANGAFLHWPPHASVSPQYNGTQPTMVQVVADTRRAPIDAITAILKAYNVSSTASATLFDDGQHGDGAAGDGVFGNTISVPVQAAGMYLSLDVRYTGGGRTVWERSIDNIAPAGPLNVVAVHVASDNLNGDGHINPGENVRITAGVQNGSPVNFSTVAFTSWLNRLPRTLQIASLPAGATASIPYDQWNSGTYFDFTVPADYPDTTYPVDFTISVPGRSSWTSTVVLPVEPFGQPPIPFETTHAGPSDWQFKPVIVDSSRVLRGHTYQIIIENNIDGNGNNGFSLRDTTDNRLILSRLAYPDPNGHTIPITDGFRVTRGDNFGLLGCRNDSTLYISSSPPWFRGFRYTLDDHAAFNGGVTTGSQLPKYFYHVASWFNPANSMRVEVRFDATHTQKAYRLRRTGPSQADGPSYMIQSPNPVIDVPFTAWDVTNPSSPRQLTLAFRDQDNNGVWSPPVDNDGYEMIFIYYKSYDPTMRQFALPPNEIPDETTIGANADIVYQLSLAVLPGHMISESAGTLYIRPWIPLTTSDRIFFTMPGSMPPPPPPPPPPPCDTTQGPCPPPPPPPDIPTVYALIQNYPNPFNPGTIIRYDVPEEVDVHLTVFNTIGQKVQTLVNEHKRPGRYSAVFDGSALPSGVYFYRMQAGSFVETKKLLLLR
jgi:hypothetical protein